MLVSSRMITGFNTDVPYEGHVYHVQTEDGGSGNPFLESLIYVGGTIVAKKLTRNQVSLKDWNANWHDHTIEIAGGRVQVLDVPPDKAKEVADLVSTTDGLIVHFYYDGDMPNGRTSVAQAVGHKPMSESEFKNFASKSNGHE